MLDSFEQKLLADAEKLLAQSAIKVDIGDCERVTKFSIYGRGQALEVDSFGKPRGYWRRAHLAPLRRLAGEGKMDFRSITENFFLSKGVRRLPNRHAKWVYSWLIPKAGTYGIFYELPERLRAEFELTPEEWEGAYQGLTSPLQGSAPRLFHQPEDSLWFLREQFEEQTLKKGGASPNHLIGLRKTFENLPEGVVREAFKEKYWGIIKQAPTKPLPQPLEGSMPDPPPKGKESKVKESKSNTNTYSSQIQKTEFDDDSIFLTSFLISKIKFNDPKAKTPPMVNEIENGNKEAALANSNFCKWASEIEKLRRIDLRETKQIETVIIWCQDDGFWKSNILSAKTLRKQFPKLLLQMQRDDWKEPKETEEEKRNALLRRLK